MKNDNETVEQVYADVIYKIGFVKDGESEKTSLSVVANRFHEAYKRELDKLKEENAEAFRTMFLRAGKNDKRLKDKIVKRDALIKKLVAAFVHLKRKICKDKRVNCKSRGNLSICKYCELIDKAREVSNDNRND